MDDEEINMLATCQRLDGRVTGLERSLIVRLGNQSTLTRSESAELKAVWDRITSFGQDEGL